MRDEYYFRLELTENEHYIVEGMITQACNDLGLDLLYYRKMKKGHIPMMRECKVRGKIGPFRQWMRDNAIETLPNEPGL